MPTKTNKKNLLKFLIALIVFLIAIIPLISADPPSSGGVIIAEFSDGNVKLNDLTGKLTIAGTEGIDTIEFANGAIPNIKFGDIVVEDGYPVSGKLFFSADSSFDLDGQHISVPKDGSIEFKDGKIIISKGTSIEVDNTKLEALADDTEIKIQGDIIEAKGRISVDYENSPNKIILTGKDTVLELQTGEKEKLEFTNSNDEKLIVNIGSFHKSEDCIEKNCISYQDMGIGVSGEEWDKLKIDGNALITKYYEGEQIYQIQFEDGKAKLRRDSLSKIENIEFDKNTIINYDNGNIEFRIDKSKESSQRIRIQTVDKSNVEIGSLTISEYLQERIEELQKLVSSWLQEEQENIEQQENPIEGEQGQYYEYSPKSMIEESKGITVELKDNEYITILELAERHAIDYKKVALYLALWEKESNWKEWGKEGSEWNPYIVNEAGFIGIGQLKAPAFKDVINWYPELFSEYITYQDDDNYLTEVLKEDIEVNAKVSVYYFELQEIKYGLGKLEYQLTGYNAGPTVTKDILYEFEKTGKTNWEDYKAFLRSKEGGLKFISSDKAEEVIDYIETICTDIGYALV
ncbi:MAG: hypothetical protein KKF74_03645 [Nanoarchaeota archaeon]|nr:hypothetical protein [Nanoarchaeota archaeon]